MATVTGIIHLQGTIGGLTFYTRLGKTVARRPGGPSAEKIRTSATCTRTRENIDEFYHGAVPAAQQLRMSLKAFRHLWEPDVSGRLNALFRKEIMASSPGIRGQRPVQLQKHMQALQGFRFGKDAPDVVFNVPYSCKVNKARNRAELVVPSFEAGRCIKAPVGATHFRLLFGMAVLSEYVFVKSGQRYRASDAKANGKSVVVCSDFMKVHENVDAFTLVAELKNLQIAESSAVPVCIGIEFYQEAGGSMYRLKEGGCMGTVLSNSIQKCLAAFSVVGGNAFTSCPDSYVEHKDCCAEARVRKSRIGKENELVEVDSG